MRQIPAALQAKLDSGATTLCRCWQIARGDGVMMGFTDHDSDLFFNGVRFEASSGLTASALSQSSGLSVDNAQAMGALSAAGLTETDISAGRFDGAQVTHWLVDWSDPALRVLMFAGSLGEITRGSGAFEAELRGLSEELNRPIGRSYFRNCDRVLGDPRCGVDVNDPALAATGMVASASGPREFAAAGLSQAEGWFTGGQIRWLTGANTGAVTLVMADRVTPSRREIELWEEAAQDIAAGDTFRILAGCDKRAETCSSSHEPRRLRHARQAARRGRAPAA